MSSVFVPSTKLEQCMVTMKGNLKGSFIKRMFCHQTPDSLRFSQGFAQIQLFKIYLKSSVGLKQLHTKSHMDMYNVRNVGLLVRFIVLKTLSGITLISNAGKVGGLGVGRCSNTLFEAD